MSWGRSRDAWPEYVPVATRVARATKQAQGRARKQGRQPAPVIIAGREIAKTFWGRAWCRNLEASSDFANRLPRGKTYVRNGSVVDLQIGPGRIDAVVAGSHVYDVSISITPITKAAWRAIRQDCGQSIDSLLDLLAGQFSDGVMQRLTRPKDGLLPQRSEMKMACTCPDGAWVCKHVAAVIYGVGSRLDVEPELLFRLRDADHQELIAAATTKAALAQSLAGSEAHALDTGDLAAIFGVDIDVAARKPRPKAPLAGTKKPVPAGTKKPALAGTKKAIRAGVKKAVLVVTTKAARVGKKNAARVSAKKATPKKRLRGTRSA
ncbi:MAG: SWIM zinc finger family protein [Pirellulales bacterium]